jgi:hypothetical protein
MKHAVVLLTSALLFAGCAYQPARLAGLEHEKLHLPQPLPGAGWSTHTDTLADRTVVRWSRADESMTLVVRRARDHAAPALFRRDFDAAAHLRPKLSYDSTVLNESPANGYGRILWKTVAAQPDGAPTITSLVLYVAGNDASYTVHRRWDRPVDATEVRRWFDYLLSVSVCDARMPEHPCP